MNSFILRRAFYIQYIQYTYQRKEFINVSQQIKLYSNYSMNKQYVKGEYKIEKFLICVSNCTYLSSIRLIRLWISGRLVWICSQSSYRVPWKLTTSPTNQIKRWQTAIKTTITTITNNNNNNKTSLGFWHTNRSLNLCQTTRLYNYQQQ